MKNKKYISITSQTLAEAQKVLVSANFELEEIWSPDNKEEIQIWSNSKTDALVQLKIVSDEKDASRKDIVNEIIDVWYEIRSIREVFDQLIEEEETFISEEEDYLLKFENKVKATRLEWEQNKMFLALVKVDLHRQNFHCHLVLGHFLLLRGLDLIVQDFG